MSEITIKKASVKKIMEMQTKIPEFPDPRYDEKTYKQTLKNKKNMAVIAYYQGQAAGYLVAYDRDADGSFYAWLAGVDPHYRRKGVMNALINQLETWSLKNNYKKIKVKSKNKYREMLHLLISNHYMLIEVNEDENIEDNWILLEKKLE